MIQFYIDLEGTVIDSLSERNFLNDNILAISKFIHRHDAMPYRVNIFTFGWKYDSEIDPALVDSIMDRLAIEPACRNHVVVKKEAAVYIFDAMPADARKVTTKDSLMEEGGFARAGYTKPDAFVTMMNSMEEYSALLGLDSVHSVLIDDMVTPEQQDRYKNDQISRLINPSSLLRHSLSVSPVLDECKLGWYHVDTRSNTIRIPAIPSCLMKQGSARDVSKYSWLAYIEEANVYQNFHASYEYQVSLMLEIGNFFSALIRSPIGLEFAEDDTYPWIKLLPGIKPPEWKAYGKHILVYDTKEYTFDIVDTDEYVVPDDNHHFWYAMAGIEPCPIAANHLNKESDNDNTPDR